MNNRNMDDIGLSERSEVAAFREIRKIRVASEEQIKQLINEAYDFAANADDVSYGRGRGAERLLTPGRDYAELPGFMARSPREIIESLPSMSRILDVGCGYGRLGAEILGTTALADLSGNSEDADIFSFREDKMPAINPSAEVYGYDAQAQRGQHRLTGVAIGNIDHLSPSTFSECPEGFDLIVSSSVLYHLPDYWGGILRMTRVVKPQGIVLASTMPRVVYSASFPHAAENEMGFLTEPDDGYVSYYRQRNVFDINGKLLPSGEIIQILNNFNPHFRLEYGVASTKMMGAITNGGQISGQRLSAEDNLDLSCMFYCLSNGGYLSYIVAQTPSEHEKLTQQGYINLHARLK